MGIFYFKEGFSKIINNRLKIQVGSFELIKDHLFVREKKKEVNMQNMYLHCTGKAALLLSF